MNERGDPEFFDVMREYDGISRAVLRDLDARFGVGFEPHAVLTRKYLRQISSPKRVISFVGFKIEDDGHAAVNLRFDRQILEYRYEILGAEYVEYKGENVLKESIDSRVSSDTTILEPVG